MQLCQLSDELHHKTSSVQDDIFVYDFLSGGGNDIVYNYLYYRMASSLFLEACWPSGCGGITRVNLHLFIPDNKEIMLIESRKK